MQAEVLGLARVRLTFRPLADESAAAAMLQQGSALPVGSDCQLRNAPAPLGHPICVSLDTQGAYPAQQAWVVPAPLPSDGKAKGRRP